jgi:hypothetical protein
MDALIVTIVRIEAALWFTDPYLHLFIAIIRYFNAYAVPTVEPEHSVSQIELLCTFNGLFVISVPSSDSCALQTQPATGEPANLGSCW